MSCQIRATTREKGRRKKKRGMNQPLLRAYITDFYLIRTSMAESCVGPMKCQFSEICVPAAKLHNRNKVKLVYALQTLTRLLLRRNSQLSLSFVFIFTVRNSGEFIACPYLCGRIWNKCNCAVNKQRQTRTVERIILTYFEFRIRIPRNVWI